MVVITNKDNIILEICNDVVFLKKDAKGVYVKTEVRFAEMANSSNGNMYEWGRIKANPGFYDAYFASVVGKVPTGVTPLKYTYDENNGFAKYTGQTTYNDEELSKKTDQAFNMVYDVEDAMCEVAESQAVKNEEIEDAICEIYEMLGE